MEISKSNIFLEYVSWGKEVKAAKQMGLYQPKKILLMPKETINKSSSLLNGRRYLQTIYPIYI